MTASTFLVLPSLKVANGSSSNASGFEVINVAWGTSTSNFSAAPGESNIALTVTLEYIFSNTAESVQGLLSLTRGFSLYNGSGRDFSGLPQAMPTGTIFELTFDGIYLSDNLTLGEYVLPLSLSWTAAGYGYVLNQSISIDVFVKGSAQISFSSTTASLAPGQVNYVPLTIRNMGSGNVSDISVTVTSQTVGILGNSSQKIQRLATNSTITLTLDIYVPSSATGAIVSLDISSTYKDPYGNSGSTSKTLDFYGESSSNNSSASLGFSAKNYQLEPGEVNTVTIVLTNAGSGYATNVEVSISSTSQAVSVVTSFPVVSILNGGSSISENVSVYVASSAAGDPVTLSLEASYVNPSKVSATVSQDLGFEALSSSNSSSNTLSVGTLENSVIGGTNSKVEFEISNIGSSAINSPTYSIILPASSPLVIASNSSYAASGSSIAPGNSEIYESYLSSSPSATAGVYSATLQIGYLDQFGTSHTESYSVAILLSGSIELVIQNEAFSQNSTSITVTGSILNEGSTSAYYSSVAGYLNGSKGVSSPDYVGEIDANSPVPFTLTLPFSAMQNSTVGNVTITIQYKNSLGQIANTSSSEKTNLQSISQLSSLLNSNHINNGTTSNQSSSSLVDIIITIVIALAALGAGVSVIVRRRSRKIIRFGDSNAVPASRTSYTSNEDQNSLIT